jgi:uncharacterized repeat protein (TIGR01451 family)
MVRGAVSLRTLVARVSFAAAVMTVIFVWGVGAAQAATTWTVASTADDSGSSACDPTTSTCPTLRDAVNNSSAGDTVNVPAGSYTLTNGQLSVAHDLTINGAGAASVTVSGNNSSRVFEIENGVTATLSGVTVTAGNGSGGAGGTGVGGGIKVFGALTLSDSVVSGNTASVSGGGIDANGTLNVERSTISNNTTTGPGFAIGGGIDCFCTGVTVDASTISGNTASGGSGNNGGGILYSSGSDLVVTNSTVSGNSASAAGGGIYTDSGISTTNATLASNSSPDGANLFVNDTSSGGFQNTIIADAQGGGTNCDTSGVFPASQGNNLEDDNSANSQSQTPSCEFTQPTDQSHVDPKLGSLADNGGPTQTMALLPGSPAIDAGATVSSITTDQRGGPRPQGAAYDVGAYEAGAIVDMAISKSGSPSPATTGQTLTYTLKATNSSAGPDPAFGVVVSDNLPSGVTFQSAATSQGSCSNSSGKVTCNLGTIAKGSSATVTIKVTPSVSGSVTNTATVSSSGSDSDASNNTASVTTQVQKAGTTAAGSKPVAVTGKATGITFRSANVHGIVNPKGSSTIYYFQFGRTTHYGSTTPAGVAGSGSSSRSVSKALARLRPGTVYHYRIVAQNSHGTVNGHDRTFRTPQRPSLHVAPSRVPPGARVRIFGNAGGCPAGDQVTLMSRAFSPAHNFAGVPAVFARVRRDGGFSTTTQIPRGRAAGRYVVTGRCGGGNLGVSAALAVIIPRFTG